MSQTLRTVGIDYNPTQKLLISSYQSLIWEADTTTGSLQMISGQFATFGSPAADGSFGDADITNLMEYHILKMALIKPWFRDLKEGTWNLVLRELDFDTQTVVTYDPVVGLGRSMIIWEWFGNWSW